MERNLDETLERLRGGSIENSWWRSVLNRFGQEYIAPDFLKNPSLQEWLADQRVSDDLKELAKETVAGGTSDDTEIRDRLIKSCTSETNENNQSAGEVVDAVTAILVAGYIASIPAEQQPLVGMLQQTYSRMEQRFDNLEEHRHHLAQLKDSSVQQFTNQAKQELSNTLSFRGFNPDKARRKLQELLHRAKNGDLVAASDTVKRDICYWTARLCAIKAETLPEAKKLRAELRQTDLDMNLSIVDALIAEAEGNTDGALRLLRDCDDSDSRSVWFGLLHRLKSKKAALAWFEEQDTSNDPQFFSPGGWINWAICAAELDRWEEACQRLLKLDDLWNEMPTLAFIDGTINAAMLLPLDFRKGAINGIPFLKSVQPSQGANPQHHHTRATGAFEFVGRKLAHQDITGPHWAKAIADWRLWLRLMNPTGQKAHTAREEVKTCMKDAKQAVDLIRFAFAFDISFDPKPLEAYLKKRKDLGGLDDRELQAELLLSTQTLKAGDLVDYLDENKKRLAKVMPSEFLARLHAEALLRDGQTSDKAQQVAKNYESLLDEDHYYPLRTLIDAHDGKDIREQLEVRYRKTGNLVDLRHLINYLKLEDDRAALRPLTREYFERSPTAENAMDVVVSLADPSNPDHDSIVEFLNNHADIVEQSDELKTAKAMALFDAGRLQEAGEINEILLKQRINPDNLDLDFNIAVASGNWKRLGGILDRAWSQRETISPEILITFAHTAGQQDQIDHALKLAKAAVDKAPNDPHIIGAAYFLYFQLGRDEEANPDWLKRAAELSSAADGPIRRVSLQELVTSIHPKHQDRLREMERKWLGGEIPLGLVAELSNVSLTRFLLHIPQQNADEQDGRHRAVLPIIAGGREPIELREAWTVGLDVSSILVLDSLGLLEIAINSLRRVKLAANVMELLFRERGEARFHQPSRIRAARQVLTLHRRGRLIAVDEPATVPETLISEVGTEHATLLQLAQRNNGKVICSLPIYRAGSLMEQEADIEKFNNLIVPIMNFCNLCHNRGKIGIEDHRRVKTLLGHQGQTEGAAPSPAILDGPIYIDELALSHMLNANVLRPLTTAGLQIRVHPDVLRDMRWLAETSDSGQELATRIDKIRHVLRGALDAGKASLLPRARDESERIQRDGMRVEATMSLLAGASRCDSFCIDDRYINSRSVFTETNGRTIPIICVLDILRYLVSKDLIDASECWAARCKLRQSGFAFITPEPDELSHWLKDAGFDNNDFVESAELRTLRQSTARADSIELASWAEGFALVTSLITVCRQVISRLWGNEEIPTEQAAKLSHWIWHNLMTTAVPRSQALTHDAYGSLIRDSMPLRLGGFLLPTSNHTQERQARYANWVENTFLRPLQPANADIVKNALLSARNAISDLDIDIDKAAYGSLFLEKLPKAAREVVIKHDPEFVEQCGLRLRQTFSIGTDIQIEDEELFESARDVFSLKGEKLIQDVAGKKVIVGLDEENQNIVLKWSEAAEDSQQIEIRDLALLSPNADVRLTTLQSIIERVGPTGKYLLHLLNEIQSRTLSNVELSETFEEIANGMMAAQNDLIHKISRGLSFSAADIAPSISYFEKFSGPAPGTQEPDVYLKDVLIPYRKSLLSRNLAAGLDICCLGALRDDLMPGQWVSDMDSDAVWNALSSCDAKGNPFSLLAALDISLYWQDDERFQKFAEEAMVQLTDKNFAQQWDANFFTLLQTIYALVLNRINLLENGACAPGYWKRMSAWMQAGVFVRALTKLSLPPDPNHFQRIQQWAQGNIILAGAYGDFVDARKEPLFSASRMPQGLRNEIMGRLNILRLRHQSEGHQVPMSDNMEQALANADKHGRDPLWDFPGPLEGHSRPNRPMPEEFGKLLEAKWKEKDETVPFRSLVIASQLFALGPSELEQVGKAIKSIALSNDTDRNSHTIFECLDLASLIAAASRDTKLANAIADAAIRISKEIPEEEVRRILAIMLRAGTAHHEQEAWFKWLEEKLANIAGRLPQKFLLMFLRHIGELETILPTASWFHLRARATALAGAP